MGISLKGNLREYSLPKILTDLHRKRATGTFVFRTSTFTKKVYLVKGDAIFAASSYEDDRLGEMLLKAGKITIEQYDKSVEILKRTKKRLGAILVDLGYLTPKDLFWGVKYQVKEIIYSLFQLEDAECEFVEGDVPTDEVITLKMSMGNLIHEGVKRIDNWTRIRREMPDTGIVLTISKDPLNLFQDVELSQYDKKMLTIIDGKKTIKEIIDSSWMNSFEAMKTIYVLWSIGILEEKTPEKKEAKEETGETVSLDELLQPFAEEEDALIKRVEEIYTNLERLRLNELLESGEDADVDTIKKNYYRLAREFHPDRYFNTSDAALKDKLTAVFDALTAAYTVLKDDYKRKEYFDSLNKQAGGIPEEKTQTEEVQKKAAQPERLKPREEISEEVKHREEMSWGEATLEGTPEKKIKGKKERVPEIHPDKPEPAEKSRGKKGKGEELFKKGVDEFKKGKFENAVGLFRQAADTDAEKAQYWSYLSLSLSKVPHKMKEAEGALLKAINLEPLNGEHYANLGFLYLKAGLRKRAAGQFEKALKFAPGNVKAQKGLKQAKESK
jgi:curved DNA-binding protein CbpA